MNEARVVLEGVAKHWDASSGLSAVSAELRAGEVTVVRGRSGSGKSTLLAILAGWCAPDAGRVVRLGEWAGDDGWRRWSGTAVVPQVLGLAEELSVGENVDEVLRLGGIEAQERDERVPALLAALDLGDLAGRLPREVSLGQQQRVAVARAAIIDPVLLLADEPTCHQDAGHGQRVVDVLHRLTARGTAVLIASHDPLVVDRADHLIVLDT